MLGLKWEDIDLKGRLLKVQRQYTHRGEFADLKSTASYRTVYFSKSVADELRKWKLQCPPSKEGLVFPSPWGGVMTTTYLRDKCIVPLREACDMPELTSHDFRHTFVSYLIADRADIKYIQSQCGHKSAMVTLDTYGHLMQTDEHRHADGVAAWYVTATLPQDAKPQVKGG